MSASCCGKWVECSECHDERSDHQFVFSKKVLLTVRHTSRYDVSFTCTSRLPYLLSVSCLLMSLFVSAGANSYTGTPYPYQ